MAEVKIGPPPSPNRDKFPFVGTANIQGIKINVENLAGSLREGKDSGGKPWSTRMKYHYGEIVRGEGSDGDKLDVYIGPNSNAKIVYIVHQNHPEDHPKRPGEYDEDKVMLGFNSPEEARRAYLKQYNRPDFFRSITAMHINKFKKAMIENKGEKVAAKKKRPSAFIRMKLREGGVKEAYALGVQLALKEAAIDLLKQDAAPPMEPVKNVADTLKRDISRGALDKPVMLKNKAPAPTSSGTFPGSTSGAADSAHTSLYGK